MAKSVGPKPVGANKYPGGNQVGGAKKAITGGVGTARSTVGNVTGGTSKAIGSATNGATKSLGGVTGGVVGGLSSTPSSFRKPITNAPKPSYPSRSNSLPKPYASTNAFPSSEKKSIVKPGQPKPFTAPIEQKKPEKKAYPGTNTPVGQGSKVLVQNQKKTYKPLPRMGAQVGKGQTMTHIAV